MMNDIRFAFRVLWRNRGFVAVVLLTLALGVGANSAVFSIVNLVFLRTLPYPAPEQLVYVCERDSSGETSVSYPNFLDWKSQQDVFSRLAIYNFTSKKLKTPERPESVPVALVSAEFFEVLGVSPIRGRALQPADDRPGAPPVAWLAHAAWEKHFGADPGLVGRTISLDDQAVLVAGILPSDFRFHRKAEVYLPIAPLAGQYFMTMRENHNDAHGIARLGAGINLDTARAQMSTIARRLEAEYPKCNTGLTASVKPLREHLAGGSAPRLLLLLGAVTLVLLIACVNVANMLLARAISREREMAIRIAIGAGKAQLVRLLITESLVLSLMGGVVGLFVGQAGFRALWQLVPWELKSLFQGSAGLDLRVLLFTLGVSIMTGLTFGLAPAWRLAQSSLGGSLKSTRAGRRTWLGRLQLSDSLVVVQMALALLLVVAAGLMIRSLQQLGRVDTGFQPQRILTLGISAPANAARQSPLAITPYYDAIIEQVRAVPGVDAAAMATSVPFTWNVSTMVFYRDEQPVPKPGAFPDANPHFVTPGYFQAMGIPLLQGRGFNGLEAQPTVPAGATITPTNLGTIYRGMTLDCVISQRMAEKYWPGENPLGKRLRLGYPDMEAPPMEIVGVVGSTIQQGLDQARPAEFYVSLRQMPFPFTTHLVVRTHQEPAPLMASVRSAVQSAVRDEPVVDLKTMTDRIAGSVSDRKFNTGLLSAFSFTALVLAVVGIYGVLSFVVSQRTREVGVRMALGAQRGDVLAGFLWRGLRLALVGSGFGLVGALVLHRWLQHYLFGISGLDPLAYAGGAAVLFAAALLASLIPARRATQVNPITAIRCE
jgi:putative ABC transport system permease protein